MASPKCPLLEIDLDRGRIKKLRIGPSMGTTLVLLVSILTMAYLLKAGIVEPSDVRFAMKLPWPW